MAGVREEWEKVRNFTQIDDLAATGRDKGAVLPCMRGNIIESSIFASYTASMLDIATLGALIAKHRTHLRLTQSELAVRARIGRSTLDALENGRIAELGFGKISRLMAALGLTLKITEANNGRPTLDELRDDADNAA